jgi:hypothetical protein
MKNVMLTILLITSFAVSAQKKNKNKADSVVILRTETNFFKRQLDSVVTVVKNVRDSILQITKKNPEKKPASKTIKALVLTTTFVDSKQWALYNLGASNKHSSFDKENLKDWLKENKFVSCQDQNDWKANQDKPAYLELTGDKATLGFYLNLIAIRRLEENLLGSEWRIATRQDFDGLYKHLASLNVKGTTPFQLLAGYTTVKEISWKGQVVHDIYGMQILPQTLYTGFDKLLINDGYIEYFSHFSDDKHTPNVTHISSSNKTEPKEYEYGNEATNYGFLVRLIKN